MDASFLRYRRRRSSSQAGSTRAGEVSTTSHLPFDAHAVQDLLRVLCGLAYGFDAVEQLVELARELLWRLHGDDLVRDELEGVLDEVELAAGHAQVAPDLLHFFEPPRNDGEVLPRDRGPGVGDVSALGRLLVAAAVLVQRVRVDRAEVGLVSRARDRHLDERVDQTIGLHELAPKEISGEGRILRGQTPDRFMARHERVDALALVIADGREALRARRRW